MALAQKQLNDAKKRRERDSDERQPITWEADAHHAALVQPRFVLVGDPGSGKSTFLRYLALCWAGETLRHGNDPAAPPDAGLHALDGWTGSAYTPIYVELRALIAGEAWSLETIGQGDIAAGLRHLRLRAGMLLEAVEQSPGTLVAVYTQQFRFLHLSFQEYLAACEHLYRAGDVRPYHLQV